MRLLVILLSVCFASLGCIHKDDAHADSSGGEIKRYDPVPVDSLRIARFVKRYTLSKDVANGIFNAYAANHWQPIWTDSSGLKQQAHMAAAFFWKYLSTGLIDSSRFLPGMHSVFDALIENDPTFASNFTAADLEVAFTSQVVRFYYELMRAKSPESIGQLEWYIPIKKGEIDWSLLNVPKDFFESPLLHAQFNLLVQALHKLKTIEKNGGWKPIHFKGRNLIPGDTSDLIALMKKRMQISEPHAPQDTNKWFDQKMANAVRQYRISVGLKDTALIDAAIVNRLNISVKSRIRTLTINLNRWKWVPPDTSTILIRVNIPAFELVVLEKGKAMKRMNAILGTPNHHTVMFYDQIRNIVFSPYWNIPKSILAKEIWSDIMHDKSYLKKNDLEIVGNGHILDPRRIAFSRYNGYTFPYLVRQKPGPKNPLGQVKFLFPNPYNIYIHDTPNKSLFEKEQRAFSHGCIRISDPSWLANYLLQDQPAWNSNRIAEAMADGEECNVVLTNPVPVYITYFTSWVDDNGVLHFRDDVYGHDAAMEHELFAKHP